MKEKALNIIKHVYSDYDGVTKSWQLMNEIAQALAREREAALEEAAKVLAGMKDGCTVDAISGVLLGDKDGPWFLKSECAAAVRALKAVGVNQAAG